MQIVEKGLAQFVSNAAWASANCTMAATKCDLLAQRRRPLAVALSACLPGERLIARLAALTLVPSVSVKTPRIAECKVHFECELHSMMNFGQGNLVVGKVIRVHVRSDIIADFKIDPVSYSPLGRIGGRRYCALGEIIDV
jgi:hypothetical protein